MTIPRRRRQPWTPPERLNELAEFRYRLRCFLGFSEAAAESAGISVQQYQLLQVIAAVPGGEASSISYIAGRMLLRHNSAVELVDRATRSGLVRRVADERDLRRSLVEITDRGAQLLARLVEMHLAEIEKEGPELMEALDTLMAVSTPVAKGSSTR
jgi:DNA-binding MarR family transcriptional regulator